MRITGATAADTGGAGSITAPGFPGRWRRLRLSCDDGPAGESLCPADAADQALALADSLLLGHDPRAVASLWDRLAEHGGDAPAAARASLDLACWDLTAKSRGEPLWKTLGGSRPRGMTHLSLRNPPESDGDLRKRFEELAGGTVFRAGQVRLGGPAETDVRRLTLIRDLLESRVNPVDLAACAGRSWPGDLLRHLREVERSVDLSWVNVTARPGDELACRRLVDGIRAAVCVGDDLTAEHEYMPWLHQRAANIIEVDIHRLGITGALRVAEAAFGFELPVVLAAAPGHVQLHLAPALPSHMSSEILDPTAGGAGFSGDAQFHDGRGVVGDRPGAGLVFERGPKPEQEQGA